jgi:signal transduction histidine kinase
VQRYANRLVYGARATPYEVLSDFASRMQRAYTGPDLLSHMARTLAEGVGAAQAAVWLNVGDSLTREAAWPQDDDDPDDVPASDGVPPDLPGDLVVPVRQDDELLGAITVVQAATDPVTPGETKLVHDVAAQAGLLLRNARLIEELRSSRQRLVTAQDEERRRLERDLHDGAQQSLVSVALTLRLATGQLAKTAPDAVPPIEQASEQLATAIDELRELARGIHPAILTEGGLGAAVNSLAERSPVPVTVENQLAGRPPSAIEATAYFVVAEALTNAVKHAQASLVTVSLEVSGDVLTVTVADDGRGGVDLSAGTGLRGLTDRVSAADGDLHVESPPGGGTRLVCTLPLPRQRVPEQPGPERGDLVASAAVGAAR